MQETAGRKLGVIERKSSALGRILFRGHFKQKKTALLEKAAMLKAEQGEIASLTRRQASIRVEAGRRVYSATRFSAVENPS